MFLDQHDTCVNVKSLLKWQGMAGRTSSYCALHKGIIMISVAIGHIDKAL